ncbi:aldo/keto reductase [Clostridium sp.]|uniref:aldo/keto reductase n=1 Tax=Clostridium sp. TaxID=1506 RepID=UPI001A4FD2F0|nr:aldo/keto reductase [Clostridium sp.]MBK5241483.1 aldo/keto reductase [Clostridium sp.]
MIKYKFLGKTGIKVSNLCFGTMSFGGAADVETSKAMFNHCREAGINFFDCADVYNNGRSEEILGQCIKECRNELVITTKGFGQMGSDINSKGLSRRHIKLAIEESLMRLGTDRVDIYFAHHFDNATPIEDTLRVLDDLVHEGKILYLGVSNWSAWQIEKALGISAKQGLSSFACIQPMYSLVKRQAEVEILPMADEEELGMITYSPLGAGLLTGKYMNANKVDSGRLIESEMYKKRYSEDNYSKVAERLVTYSKERGIIPASLAIAWVMANQSVTAPIIGARNVKQLEVSLAATDINMTDEWRNEISLLSIEPPSPTDRTEELK